MNRQTVNGQTVNGQNRDSDQERFLARIRQALGRGEGVGSVAQQPAESACRAGRAGGIAQPPRTDHPGDDPAAWPARFIAELEAVGGSAELVAREAIGRAAAVYGAQLSVSRVLAWDPAVLPGEAGSLLETVLQGLAEAGANVQTWSAAVAAAADAELGVVVAEAAVAASGTVMVSSGPGKGRSVSLLPENLLVLVPTTAMRPTLAEALADVAYRTRSGDIPQNVSFITGPSKSADIEQRLITGVHGPRTVHALVVA